MDRLSLGNCMDRSYLKDDMPPRGEWTVQFPPAARDDIEIF
ncbi:MAG: hypothetical protein Q6365_020220 [Candidatus Sigynarchaeota archaeon]